MSKFDKAYSKFTQKPIPNDITFDEVMTIAKHFGCEVKGGGKHPKVVHRESGIIIPVPKHGKCVGEAYIKELKELFDFIGEV